MEEKNQGKIVSKSPTLPPAPPQKKQLQNMLDNENKMGNINQIGNTQTGKIEPS